MKCLQFVMLRLIFPKLCKIALALRKVRKIFLFQTFCRIILNNYFPNTYTKEADQSWPVDPNQGDRLIQALGQRASRSSRPPAPSSEQRRPSPAGETRDGQFIPGIGIEHPLPVRDFSPLREAGTNSHYAPFVFNINKSGLRAKLETRFLNWNPLVKAKQKLPYVPEVTKWLIWT